MIQSLLIANRGEIACRIIRTARQMGIRAIAVYSNADGKALHVGQADEAIHIGPSPAIESYLAGDKIIAAAKASGAEAIHPGYGFLSENADFAQAVIDAGLIWVGPRPESIRAMGLKDAAKKRMQEAGVPTTPGYLGEDQSPERLASEADAIGYPILIKAVAGGGGKGMRRVDRPKDFADALQSCQREAASSFGNTHVLLEKWIASPRHIEVQVFGDVHGNIVHLFERDCSLQRRHQKVIEEAPAPGMDDATRQALYAAAVRAAKAVDYVGAGTIEFIADVSKGLSADRIWFMEMNTRLQVEHPVTEAITGVDLVEWQLRVADGEPLPKRQEELSINGWAMEARLYAEDPTNGFLPSTGALEYFRLPHSLARIDSGVEEGGMVSPFYDPMIAKLIVHAPERGLALRQLAEAAGACRVWPVKTNDGFLRRLLLHPEIDAGRVQTSFINTHLAELAAPIEPDALMLRLAGAALMFYQADGHAPEQTSGMLSRHRAASPQPWTDNLGFRMNAPPRMQVRMKVDESVRTVVLDQKDLTIPVGVWIETSGDMLLIGRPGELFACTLSQPRGSGGGAALDGAILSPMPGRLISVVVAEGELVTKGQKLVTLEAMKMEHSLISPFDGMVAELNVAEGAQVVEGMLLARIVREAAS